MNFIKIYKNTLLFLILLFKLVKNHNEENECKNPLFLYELELTHDNPPENSSLLFYPKYCH